MVARDPSKAGDTDALRTASALAQRCGPVLSWVGKNFLRNRFTVSEIFAFLWLAQLQVNLWWFFFGAVGIVVANDILRKITEVRKLELREAMREWGELVLRRARLHSGAGK